MIKIALVHCRSSILSFVILYVFFSTYHDMAWLLQLSVLMLSPPLDQQHILVSCPQINENWKMIIFTFLSLQQNDLWEHGKWLQCTNLSISNSTCIKRVIYLICEFNLDTYILWYVMLIVKEQCFCFSVRNYLKFTKELQIAKCTLLLSIKYKLEPRFSIFSNFFLEKKLQRK